MEIRPQHVKTIKELKDLLSSYQRIIVLGPQRSGTNFTADVISEETGIPAYSERSFGYTSCLPSSDDSREKMVKEFLLKKKSYVLQAPALTYDCHSLFIPDAVACFMLRHADEIEASRTKSDWPGAQREWIKYTATFPKAVKDNARARLADLQLSVWNNYQRHAVKMPFIEIPFEILSKHHLWVSPEHRENFQIGQTRKK